MRYLKINEKKNVESNILNDKCYDINFFIKNNENNENNNINKINKKLKNKNMKNDIKIKYNYNKVKHKTVIEELVYNTLKKFYNNIYPYEYKEIYDILKNYNNNLIINYDCYICYENCNNKVKFDCGHSICMKCYLKNYIYSKEHSCPFCKNNLNFSQNKYYLYDSNYKYNLFGSKIFTVSKLILNKNKNYILYNDNIYVKNLLKKLNKNNIIDIEDIKKNNIKEINILLLNYIEENSINNDIINMLKENKLTDIKKINIDIFYYENAKNML